MAQQPAPRAACVEVPEKKHAERPRGPLSLRVNFSWTLVGNVIYAACQWGMLATLAKFGTPTLVGEFSLGLAISAPVFMFANLNLRAVQATDAQRSFSFGDYVRLRLLTSTLALAGIGLLLALSGYDLRLALIIGVIAVAKASESMSDICYGRMQQHERMDLVARSMIARGTIALLGLLLAMAATGSLLVAVVVMALAWAGVYAAYDARQARQFVTDGPGGEVAPGAEGRAQPPGARRPRIRKLAVLALPLGLVMMLISLNSNVPRYFIEHELGTDILGFYSALVYLTVAGTTVVSALGKAASPRLAQLHAARDVRGFVGLQGVLLAVAVALGLGGWLAAHLFGDVLLALLYTEDYAAYAALFAALMGVATVSYVGSMLGYGMTAMRRFNVQLPIFIAMTGTTTALCVLLVPSHGLTGIVWALLSAALVQVAASAAVVYHGVRAKPTTSQQA